MADDFAQGPHSETEAIIREILDGTRDDVIVGEALARFMTVQDLEQVQGARDMLLKHLSLEDATEMLRTAADALNARAARVEDALRLLLDETLPPRAS